MMLDYLVYIFVLIISVLIFYAWEINQYWTRRGLVGPKPMLFFGNTFDVFRKKKHLVEIFMEIRKDYPNTPLVGFFKNWQPRLIVQDPDFIEDVLIKDFSYFHDRKLVPEEIFHSVSGNQLFILGGKIWRAVRTKFSPMFTVLKMKLMFDVFITSGSKLLGYLLRNMPLGESINISKACNLYTLHVIGSSAFGLDTDVMDNPESEFVKYGNNVFHTSYFHHFFTTTFPRAAQFLNISHAKLGAREYFCELIQESLNERNKSQIYRNDFVQMMIELKQKGTIDIQTWDEKDEYLRDPSQSKPTTLEITDNLLISQAYTFLTTGFGAVSASMANVFLELAINICEQDNIRKEIWNRCKEYDGITYEALKKMTELDNAIKETLRLHPIAPALFRVCVKDYTFRNGFKVYRGELLNIPVRSIHLDPQYFTEPTKFKPDRFNSPMRPGIYFPFGGGPRICIAMRYSMLIIKFGVARVLNHYRVTLDEEKTKLPYKFNFNEIVSVPDKPHYVKLEFC